MAIRDSEPEVPTWVASTVVAAVTAVVFGYIFIYGGAATAPLGVLLVVGQVGLVLFVLYLLYRFVVAVETIAEKL
jgi:hypothetical protein